MGAKKRPYYRLVVADARSPLTDPATIRIDAEKVNRWLAQGAQPSDAARSLLQREGILERHAATRPRPAV